MPAGLLAPAPDDLLAVNFDEAWGVVEVKRVASDALLGETRVAIVGVWGRWPGVERRRWSIG